MAKRACGGKKKLRRGLWSPEEDEKLMSHIAKWSQIAAQLPGRTDNEVKNFWNSYIKKKLRQRGIDPATHKPLAEDAVAAAGGGSGGGSKRAAVFSDAELIMQSAFSISGGHHLLAPHMPPPVAAAESYMYSRCSTDCDGAAVGGGGCISDGSLSLSGYSGQTAEFTGYVDADALHCGGPSTTTVPGATAVIPSVSSSSTLNSMAGLSPGATTTDEQSTTTTTTNHDLPWLELGTTSTAYCDVAAAAAGDHYGAALDELKWSDYVFDGCYGAMQGHGIYGDSKLDTAAVHFDAHGLGSW
ncbi:hypothetical protein ABZP36_001148 [Zizania latifolia]